MDGKRNQGRDGGWLVAITIKKRKLKLEGMNPRIDGSYGFLFIECTRHEQRSFNPFGSEMVD